MAIDRSKRTSFDDVADIYLDGRATYPNDLIENIIERSSLTLQDRILEIGCGPGNSTLPFAKRGFHITAIELGKKLAAHAAKNCRNYPNVQIHNIAFEEWDGVQSSFDLVYAIDAIHWIKPQILYPKVARLLKPYGSAVFCVSVPSGQDTAQSLAIDRVYQDIAPDFPNPRKRYTAEWLKGIMVKAFEDSGLFGPVYTEQHIWMEHVTADRYIKGLRTFSSHKGIDEIKRERLYEQIAKTIERFGGTIEKDMSVLLFHAKVAK